MDEAGSGIMAKKIGDFCTEICYFIWKNMTENGPLEFHTVLYFKYDDKLERSWLSIFPCDLHVYIHVVKGRPFSSFMMIERHICLRFISRFKFQVGYLS